MSLYTRTMFCNDFGSTRLELRNSYPKGQDDPLVCFGNHGRFVEDGGDLLRIFSEVLSDNFCAGVLRSDNDESGLAHDNSARLFTAKSVKSLVFWRPGDMRGFRGLQSRENLAHSSPDIHHF